MGRVIAMAGKGGTGKTTIAALIVRMLKEKKLGSILAVDADPNSNLGETLGLQVDLTVGEVLDDIAEHPEKVPLGMGKDHFIEYQVQTAISEGDGFDCLTIGRPEGPGCYCYVNNTLRNVMARLIKDYDFVIIDNEAGLEHLSRRTTRSADAFVIVSNETVVGLKAAKRIKALIKELKINAKNEFLIINSSANRLEAATALDLKMDYLGNVPFDKEIEKISLNGGSLMKLDTEAESYNRLKIIGEKIWQCN